MKPLLELADRHPAITGTIGTAGGVLGYCMKELHLVACVAADLGMIFGAATAFVGLLIALRRIRSNADQRRQHRDQEIDNDHLS